MTKTHTRRRVLRKATIASSISIVGLGAATTAVSATNYKELDIEGGSDDAEYEIVVNTHGENCYETDNIEPSQRNGETGLEEGVYNEKSGQDFSMLTGHADRWDHDTYLIPENAEVYKIRIDGTGYVTVDPPYNDVKSGSLVVEGSTTGCCNSCTVQMNNSYATEGCGDPVTGDGELESGDIAGDGYVYSEMDGPDYGTDSDCYSVYGAITETSMNCQKGGFIKCTYSASQ